MSQLPDPIKPQVVEVMHALTLRHLSQAQVRRLLANLGPGQKVIAWRSDGAGYRVRIGTTSNIEPQRSLARALANVVEDAP
jgi:hypothetical protein